jgi:DNA-binding FadR family transcriptional regulator
LRDQVLSGELSDGAMLPPQDKLIADFGVSPPSLREAFRILETEGLVTVVRGNVGGAEVQRPGPERVAYLLSMVLQANGVSIDDVATSLGELEAVCAAMIARRADRSSAVAQLRSCVEESRAAFDDTETYVRVARQFHEDLVRSCGNDTLGIVLGAIEALWSAHVANLMRSPADLEPFADLESRTNCLATHTAIVDAIECGDAEGVAQLLRDHMNEPTKYRFVGSQLAIRSSIVRDASADNRLRPVP